MASGVPGLVGSHEVWSGWQEVARPNPLQSLTDQRRKETRDPSPLAHSIALAPSSGDSGTTVSLFQPGSYLLLLCVATSSSCGLRLTSFSPSEFGDL